MIGLRSYCQLHILLVFWIPWCASFSPFKGNEHGDKHGAAEYDVVERVDNLGEEDGVELPTVREGPLEDSGHAVVKQTENKEDIVETGKDYQEVVEGACHLARGEDVDWEGVPNESKYCHNNLGNRVDFNRLNNDTCSSSDGLQNCVV